MGRGWMGLIAGVARNAQLHIRTWRMRVRIPWKRREEVGRQRETRMRHAPWLPVREAIPALAVC